MCEDIGLNFIVGLLFPEMLPRVMKGKISRTNDI